MADIDLIPKQYLLRRLIQRRCRWFLAVLLAIGCLVGVARAALWFGTSHEQQEIARLKKNELDSAQIKARMQEYEQQKAAAEKQLKALADVRGRGRIRAVLEALDAAYLSGVWFDEVRSHRVSAAHRVATEVAPGTARSGPAAAPQTAQPTQPAANAAPPRTEQRVELVGHAVDHSRLATLMTRLSEQPGVSEVQLLDTNARAYSTATIIDFKVSFSIAQKAQP